MRLDYGMAHVRFDAWPCLRWMGWVRGLAIGVFEDYMDELKRIIGKDRADQ